MQICANELKTVLKNVLAKREYAEEMIVTFCVVSSLTPSWAFLHR